MQQIPGQKIGPFECLSLIGKGGMGEVYLVKDPACERQVALKRIRPELMQHASARKRFLQEAKLTAQLSHPGIISIHSIHQEKETLYYLMPYIPGKGLKEILKEAHQHPQKEEGQIKRLLPIFHQLCQTVSYAHAQGILHRDLKPENILVGNFGEVIVLDWGLAQKINAKEKGEDLPINEDASLTNPGKMLGTVSYMAPERAQDKPSSIQTDVYALGVILYQILTLRFPFKRTNLKEFRKTYAREHFIDPVEMAPYRDVPPALSQIVKQCLEADPAKRYQTVDALLNDLQGHLEGRSQWFLTKKLNLNNKKHWQIAENLMISKHSALSSTHEESDWFGVQFTRSAFAERVRVEVEIIPHEGFEGVGILMGTPHLKRLDDPLSGYSLWLGSLERDCVQLFCHTVEVKHLPNMTLEPNKNYRIVIEKYHNQFQFWINNEGPYVHISYVPIFATHLGILYKDRLFEMKHLELYTGSHDLEVSCLSVPDAFLANGDFKRALSEFRRISHSFPGHQEGRDALFRAGVTLMEIGKHARSQATKEKAYLEALDEFSKLHATPGAPLEYLGKALVYQTMRDSEEEVKALELGLRRYQQHPLTIALQEQVIFRMHHASQRERKMTYQLILIVLRLMQEVMERSDSKRLFRSLIDYWEPLPFFETTLSAAAFEENHQELFTKFSLHIAFWTANPHILEEVLRECINSTFEEKEELLGDALYALYELGCLSLAKQCRKEAESRGFHLSIFECLEIAHEKGLKAAYDFFLALDLHEWSIKQSRIIFHLMRRALNQHEEELVHLWGQWAAQFHLSKQEQIELDSYLIWAYLHKQEWKKAEELFERYPLELLNQESTRLHPLYGCWLLAVEGEEIALIHFNGVIDTPFPRSWALLSHELSSNIQEQPSWYQNAFLWEKRCLYAHLALYYRLHGQPDMEAYYRHLEKKETTHAPS